MSLSELHYQGGVPFMIPMDIIAIINLFLIVYILVKQKDNASNLLELLKQLGGFALAWGAFSTLVGLFQAFRDLSNMENTLPFNVISGGLKVALITVLYGFLVYIISLLAYIGIRAFKKVG